MKYLILGEERYLSDMELSKIKSALQIEPKEFNLTEFEGKLSLEEFYRVALTAPLFAPNRLIVIKNCSDIAKIEDIQSVPDTTVVVFICESIDKRTKLYKHIKKDGKIIEIGMPKDATLKKFIRSLADIGEKEMDFLIEICGNDMYSLKNEILKLKSIADERKITKEDILQNVSKTTSYNAFLLHDYLVSGQTDKAMRLLCEVLDAEKTAIPIMAMLMKKFSAMFIAKQCELAKYDYSKMVESISKTMGLHPYAAKLSVKDAQKYTLEHIENALQLFAKYDFDIKMGRTNGIRNILLRIYNLA